MTATILDGRPIAREQRTRLAVRIEDLRLVGKNSPSLRVLLFSQDEAAAIYVENLRKSGQKLGIEVDIRSFQAPTERDLEDAIEEANADPEVDGVLVPVPLPAPLSPRTVQENLDPDKDVDGVTVVNAGRLYLGISESASSVAEAILELVLASGSTIRGMEAVVVGRSNVVGRPVAMLLLHADATVALVHRATADLNAHTRRADILVAAAGVPRLIRAQHVKPGAVVIDAGIHELEGGLVGDVDFESVREVAGAITPVPGGVGPLTNVALLRRVVTNAEKRAHAA